MKYKVLSLMKAHKIPAMELATKCQVHVQSIYNWSKIPLESPLSMPADQLKKMADIFNVSMEEMYTESDLITA